MDTTTIAEVWKPVVGYEGVYEVSNTGLVRRVCKYKSSFPALGTMKTQPNINGYPSVGLRKCGKSKRYRVHCLVLIAFVGPRPNGFHCNHKNGVKTDNRVENLEWVTPEYNYKHADLVLHKVQRGEKHHCAILSEDDVIRIRSMFNRGIRTRDIAKEYKVHKQTISDVVNGKTWNALIAAARVRLENAEGEQ